MTNLGENNSYKEQEESKERDFITPKWDMEKRSIYDNLFTLQAIIDYNANRKKDTYILFVDAKICFDRLWLNDASNELNKIWLPEEVELIRNMNSCAIVTSDTPVGYTNEMTLHNIVKQGIIMGPILCIVYIRRIHPVAVTGSPNLLCCILRYFIDFAFCCCVI